MRKKKSRIQFRKISTKLVVTYSCIVFLIFHAMCLISINFLRHQYKKELIRTDKEALHQISSSIILMTDLMVEKMIQVYSNSNVRMFFSEFSALTREEFAEQKARDYEMVKELREVRKILRENGMLYTQMNGAVTLITEKGAIFTSWPQDNSLDYSASITKEKAMWDQFFRDNLTNYKWEIVNERDAMSFQKDTDKNMLMCIYHYRVSQVKEGRGYICISIDARELEKCYESWMDENMSNEIFLLDEHQERLVSLNQKEKISISEETLKEIRREVRTGCTEGSYEDEKFIYDYRVISQRDWILVNKIPQNYIARRVAESIKIFIVILAAGCLCACALVMAFTFRFSNRIRYLKRLMTSAASEKYSLRYQSKYDDELDEIGESFNLMEDEIRAYTQKLVEEEKKKKLSEINYLHAQINTHFLYNIFNSIKMLSVLHRNEDINELITSLVRLLRGTLDVSEEMLTLEEEMQNVEHYFRIENIVHLQELELHVECADEFKKKMIPKLLIQPIVENCIIHGFKRGSSSSGQHIWISVEEDFAERSLYIKIMDNGCGISKQQMMNIKSFQHGYTRSIGIRNIEERIEVLFGRDYGIEIESTVNKGTTVLLKIPSIEQEKG